jgi:hypothetical protein
MSHYGLLFFHIPFLSLPSFLHVIYHLSSLSSTIFPYSLFLYDLLLFIGLSLACHLSSISAKSFIPLIYPFLFMAFFCPYTCPQPVIFLSSHIPSVIWSSVLLKSHPLCDLLLSIYHPFHLPSFPI